MRVQLFIFLAVLMATNAGAKPSLLDRELEFLLDSVAQSDCTFTRNGREHSGEEAADHLRMKYRRAGSRIKATEQFIDKLASRSSLSGKPYTLRCGEAAPQQTGLWLHEKLASFRADGASPTSG